MTTLEILRLQLFTLETTLTNDSSRRILERVKAMVEIMIEKENPPVRNRPIRVRELA